VLAAAVVVSSLPAQADSGGAEWLARAFATPSPVAGSTKRGRSGAGAKSDSSAGGAWFNGAGSGAGESGMASYYWQPQKVAAGGWFNPNALTAAHKTLPFGTRVKVTHMSSGRSVMVVINDRGPFVKGRIIDLSRAAAQSIGMTGAGVAAVRVERM
jgi:rare lipoprotein A